MPKHSAAVFVFERPCVEAICGVALSVILVIASRWGWAWDFGFFDDVSWEDDKLRIRGDEKESGMGKAGSKSERGIEGRLKV